MILGYFLENKDEAQNIIDLQIIVELKLRNKVSHGKASLPCGFMYNSTGANSLLFPYRGMSKARKKDRSLHFWGLII